MTDFWRGKRVLLTGHTGFKGAWLKYWLLSMGANVYGLSLPAMTDRPSLHTLLFGSRDDQAGILDIRDRIAVLSRVQSVRPEIVFHLAAQPLVRAGYREPVETFDTNVMGTVNLLDALRASPEIRSIVVVTTDKVYENHELSKPFAESDPLGGHDPYSASKAAADIVTSSYRRSYFLPRGVGLASARAGNVIGGGDWADDRLVPDAVRAVTSGLALEIRRPAATRPWQHVLEPLNGYMLLAERLWADPSAGPSFNFGPDPSNAASVRTLIERSDGFIAPQNVKWGPGDQGPHEAGFLLLDSSSAKAELGFLQRFDLAETLDRTWEWYRAYAAGSDATGLCQTDISAFEAGKEQKQKARLA